MIYVQYFAEILIILGGTLALCGGVYIMFWYIPMDYIRDREWGMLGFHISLCCLIFGATLFAISQI